MRLLLRSDLGNHQGIPKEYELETQPAMIKSTFIFNERDLPGYKARNKVRAEAAAAGIPAHLLRQKERENKPEENHSHHGRRRGRRQEYFRKAIPSKHSSPPVLQVLAQMLMYLQRKRPSQVGSSTR